VDEQQAEAERDSRSKAAMLIGAAVHRHESRDGKSKWINRNALRNVQNSARSFEIDDGKDEKEEWLKSAGFRR